MDDLPYKAGDELCGRFVIEERLDAGMCAVAYRAREALTGEEVAIKVGRSTGLLDRTLLEQHTMLRGMFTPALVRSLGLFVHCDDPTQPEHRRTVLALELIRGTPIRDWSTGQPKSTRLAALVEVAHALTLLHEADKTHGDLHGGNVLVQESPTFRVVLIDPDGANVGWTGRSTSPRPTSHTDDHLRLADLLDDVMAPGDDVVTQLARSLRNEREPKLRMGQVLDALRAALAAPVALSPRGAIQNVAERAGADEAARHDLYRQISAARRAAIEGLFNAVRAAASHFSNLRIETVLSTESAAAEDQALSGARGYFARRSLVCRTLDDHMWSVEFDEVAAFYKPYPYEDDPTSLGAGTTRLEPRYQRLADTITLQLDGSAVHVAFPIEATQAEWLTRNFQLLTGARIALLPQPHDMPATRAEQRKQRQPVAPAAPRTQAGRQALANRRVAPPPSASVAMITVQVPYPNVGGASVEEIRQRLQPWADNAARAYFSSKSSLRVSSLATEASTEVPRLVDAAVITSIARVDVIPDDQARSLRFELVLYVRTADRSRVVVHVVAAAPAI